MLPVSFFAAGFFVRADCGKFPIIKGLIQLCWFFFKWGLVLAVFGVLAVVAYLYHQMDDEIRRVVESRIAAHYSHLVVSVRSAQLVEGKGIEIHGLSISEPGGSDAKNTLVYLDEIFVYCNTNWQDLLAGRLHAQKVLLRSPTIRATRGPDGSYNAGQLLPLPRLSDQPPPGVIENGVIEIYDPATNPPSCLVLRNAQLHWDPTSGTNVDGNGGQWIRVQGEVTGDHVRRMTIDALLNSTGGAWSASGSVDGLDVAPEFIRSLPGDIAGRAAPLIGLRGRADAQFRLAYNGAAAPRFNFEVTGQLTNGRIDDARLPYPLTDLQATFQGDPQKLVVSDLSAQHGQAQLQLALQRGGYGPQSPLSIKTEARRLRLDKKLLDVLPDAWQDQWYRYLPEGEIDVDLSLQYDGQTWRPEVVVRCLDVSFTHHQFPYRLQRGRGTLVLKNNQLSINLLGFSRSEEVRLVGELQLAGPQTFGWLEVRGNNVQIDETLLAAMPKEPRDVVRSLHLHGTVNLFMRFAKQTEADTRWHQYLLAGLNHCSLRWDDFPYPIDDVRGTFEMQDDAWTFRDLVGRNDTGQFTCDGHLAPAEQGGQLQLHFTATNVPLEPELRDALNPQSRQAWDDVKPRGAVNLHVEVRCQPNQYPQHVWIRAEPVEDTVSIEPTCFPYRLDRLHGVFIFADGHLRMEQIRARHGNTTFSAQGDCRIQPDGGWSLRLEKLAVDRLIADRALVAALPERLKKSLAELEPTGACNLRGNIELAGSAQPGAPLASSWDLAVDFQGNNLRMGVDLKNLHGGLALVGRSDGQRFHCFGEIKLDSLMYKDVQLTEVMGPLWLDNEQMLLGMWADRTRGAPSQRHMTAKLYGGTLVGDGWANLGEPLRWAFGASLAEGDLGQVARQSLAGRQQLSGKVLATIDLRGTGRGASHLAGRGNIRLRDADIYELPLMVALLKILSVRPPDATAFTESDIDFRIEGQHVYVDKINFKGDAVSLLGKGEMNLNRDIRLQFYAMVGRDELHIPVIRDLVGGASQQFLMIHVDGTLDIPVTRKEAFPAVSQALQQIQAELQGRQPASAGPWPQGNNGPAGSVIRQKRYKPLAESHGAQLANGKRNLNRVP